MGTYSTAVRATPVPQEDPSVAAYQAVPPQQQHANVLQVLESSNAGGVSIENEDLFLKGEAQPLEYRDRPFAIAFVVQCVAILGTALALGPAVWQDAAEDEDAFNEQASTNTDSSSGSGAGLWLWLFGTCLTSMATVAGALMLLMRYPHQMIRVAFFAAPILFCGIAVATALDEEARNDGLPVFYATCAAIFGAFSLCWYGCLKRYMPFAAANLRSALTAVHDHKGLLVVSLGNGLVSFVWIALWLMALSGVDHYVKVNSPQQPCMEYDDASGTFKETGEMCDASIGGGLVLLLLLSFYWAHQVIQNVLHVTTAGTVGTWWFTSANSGNSSGLCGFVDVGHSLSRALTYSFGSICLGSLLVAILQTLESMLKSQRRNRRGNAILLCILECLVHLLRRWMEYFNSWAFVYVALYGYDYITAGKNVVRLFKSTGWTTFIADRLVYRVMFLCHLSIGILAGYMSLLMDNMVGPVFADDTTNEETSSDDRFFSHLTAFFCGMMLGMFLSSTALFVVESATRTVIVCFAESPNEFQINHPDLCEEMMQGWSETYPEAWASRRNNNSQTADVPMASARVSGGDSQESVRLV